MSTPDRQAATTVAREPRTIKYVKAISEALTEEMERDERVVLFVTGNGLKALHVFSRDFPPIVPVAPNPAAVDAYLGGIVRG